MDSIQPSFSGKNPAKPNQPFEQTNLRNSIIKSINDLLPTEGQALHTAAKVHFQSYGKLIRGITALMMAQAVGLDKKCGINWALSVELMHNASLVHDDICDGDTQRRKNSTVWSATSERTAICFGDWLVAKSFEAAIESCSSSDREKLGAVSRLAQTMIRLCEGQSSEFETPPILDWHSYDKVVLEKTTSLILAAGEGPLLLGGVIDYQSNIKRALSYLGIAYQINNDIDDIAVKNLGRIPGDLRRRTPNAVIVAFYNLLENHNKSQFVEWISTRDIENIDYWAQQFSDSGAIEICRHRSLDLLNSADQHLNKISKEFRAAFSPLIQYLERTNQRHFG